MANTLWNTADQLNVTLSNANLTATGSASAYSGVRTTDRQVTGKYYFEFTVSTWGNASTNVGIATANCPLNKESLSSYTGAVTVYHSGAIFVGPTSSGSTLGTQASGNIIGVALDLGAQLIFFRVAPSGNWNGSATANPATGAGGIAIGTQTAGGADAVYGLAAFAFTADVVTANFGDSTFSGTVPTGFTSGFPTGTPPLKAALTQIGLEQWGGGAARAQLSQVAIEQWSTPTGIGIQAVLSQIAVEQWGQIPISTNPPRPQIFVAT